MSDPRTDPGNPGPSGWQPSYPPAPPSQPPQAGPYQNPPPAGAPQQAWSGWQGPPPNQAIPPSGPAAPGGPGSQAPGEPGSKHQSHGRTQLALGAGIGFVVALAVVGVLLLTHVLSLGSGSESATAADTRPITMPETLGGMSTLVAVTTEKGGADKGKQMQQRNDHTIALTTEAYQKAYDGAAVGVQLYTNDELLFYGTAIAVRAESPGLTLGPVSDPADIGLAQNMREIVAVGDAECLVVHTRGTRAGETPDPDDSITSLCQRSGPDGTAMVYGNAGRDGGATQTDVVKMVDELYAQLGTG